jgi:two-component system, sensor histidine kinase
MARASQRATLSAVAHLADEDKQIEEELDPAKASILIVDDVPANLLAMKAVLEPLGHQLVTASSGEEALRRLMSEEFALILMDVMMPEMDGYQTVALIKRRPKTEHVPIIFVSAIAKEVQHISKGYHYGAVDYITKPFDAEILRAKVSVLVTLHLQAEKILRQQALLLQRRHELEQQRLQQRLTEEQSRMKDQFLAIISHELRTPLNVIVGWSDLLVSKQMNPEKTRAALESIQRNAKLQKKLVDDLLDVSRMILGKLILDREETNLAALVRSAVENATVEAAAKGVHVSQRIDPRCDSIRAAVDTERMLQVLGNLIGNAVKFTPPGGHVEIALAGGDGRAVIEVSDDGAGIDPAELPFVFDRFWQGRRPGVERRAAPGLGLGLAIVRQLVELHGGTVSGDSAGKGQGARFTVTLPIAQELSPGESDRAAAG